MSADGQVIFQPFLFVNKNQGATFAIYPHGDMEAMRQVEQMRVDGRINMYAEADYREGTTAYMWICHKIKECAERIRKREREKYPFTHRQEHRNILHNYYLIH